MAQTPTYRLGTPDWECRYPVLVGGDVIGAAFRWHREWLTLSSAGEQTVGRPEKGTAGVDMAAAHLAEQYAAGHITALSLADVTAPVPVLVEPVPLLHPRMPHTARNIATATAVLAPLDAVHRLPRQRQPLVAALRLVRLAGPALLVPPARPQRTAAQHPPPRGRMRR